MRERLLARARTALYNPNEVSEELADVALSEANELVEGKPLPDVMLLDLAIVRLKMHLKVEVSAMEEKMADVALKMAKSLKGDTQLPPKGQTCVVGVRESIWA